LTSFFSNAHPIKLSTFNQAEPVPITGARDLLEIPLHWQAHYIYQCDFTNKTCPEPK
jgi:hypothetical protein